GVFTEVALEPRCAGTGPSVAVRPPGGVDPGSPTATAWWQEVLVTSGTNHAPVEGTSIVALYMPGIGLSGDRSWHSGYAVNGNHCATKGPTAFACGFLASHTVGFPAVRRPPSLVVMSKPNVCRPGVTGTSVERRVRGCAPFDSRAMVAFAGPPGAAGGEGAGLGVLGASHGRAASGLGRGVGGGFGLPPHAVGTRPAAASGARDERRATGL